VARVDGEAITLAEVAEAARELPEELRGAPPQVLFPVLLDQMITQRAVVAAARRAGLDRDPAVAARIRRAEEQELQQALLSREVAAAAGAGEDALRRRYDQAVASRPAEDEVRARHILVPSEAEARAALAEARRPGADFAEVARRRSTGPGAREGGDLGFFKRGDMVPEFAAAAFALQAGQISEAPVQSPFGWHVIKVEERRAAPPPAFEEVRDQLRQQLLEEQVTAAVERIRAAARVERFNLDGTPQQPARPPGGGGLLDNAAPPPPAGGSPQRR
jgi:peptidyl-prolyl cis-trans isomerase C